MEALAERIAMATASGRVWVDVDNLGLVLDPDDVAACLLWLKRHRSLLDHLVTPVVRTSSPEPVIRAAMHWASQSRSGLAVRIDGLTHLKQKATVLEAIVAEARMPPTSLDVFCDAQDLARTVDHAALSEHFPLTQEARSWFVLAGGFPASVTHLSPDEYEHHLDRPEWTSYVEEVERAGEWRIPGYGDYATQAPRYTPSPAFPPSPSVRYTTRSGYVVIRGRRMAAGNSSQYLGHSRFLIERDYFGEVTATDGDRYIKAISTGKEGTGNPTTWRMASLFRHLGVVAAQLAALEPALVRRHSPGA